MCIRDRQPVLLKPGQRDQNDRQSGHNVAHGDRNEDQGGAQYQDDQADNAAGWIEWRLPPRMDHLLQIFQHRNGTPHQSGEVSCWERMGGDTAWKDRSGMAEYKLARRDHEQQAGGDRNTRCDRRQAQQEHDDTERALAQAGHEPAQCEAVSYTHLDVYKRQEPDTAFRKIGCQPSENTQLKSS